MSDNPFQPPEIEQSELAEETDPPRYQGSIEVIRGEIDEGDAIALLKRCVPIPTQERKKPDVAPNRFSVWFIVFIAFGFALAFFWDRSGPPSQPPTTQPYGLGASILVGLLVPFAVFVGIVYWMYRRGSDMTKADPCLGGENLFRLTELGVSIEKQARDGRLIELFCSWRQLIVSECESAWSLNMGLSHPFVLPKAWVENSDERVLLEALFRDTAQWRSEQPVTMSLADVPDEAMESFPSAHRDGVPISIDAKSEQALRRRLARLFRHRFPSLVAERRWLKPALLSTVYFAAAFPLVAAMVSTGGDIQSALSSRNLLWIGVPPLIILSLLFWFLWLIRKGQKGNIVTGSIDQKNLWLNYRAQLLRQTLDNFPKRFRYEDSLLLESENKETVFVLDRIYFQSDEAFEAAADLLAPETILTND